MKRGSRRRLSFEDTDAAPPSEADARLESLVRSLLWDTFVIKAASDAYGLKWRYGTADAPREHIGGWLYACHRDTLTKRLVRGKLAFFIIDDGTGLLRQCKDDSAAATLRSFPFKQVAAARAYSDTASGMAVCKLYSTRGAKHDWLLSPVQSTSEDIVVRWAAALRHRAGHVPGSFLVDRTRAQRVALWAQSKVRQKQALAKARRRRARREGLLARLKTAVRGAPEDTDSDDSDADEDEDERALAAQRARAEQQGTALPSAPFLVTFVSALAADLYDNAFGGGGEAAAAAVTAAAAKGAGAAAAADARARSLRRSLFRPGKLLAERLGRAAAGPRVKRISGFDDASPQAKAPPAAAGAQRNSALVQDSFAVAPLQPFELEDELWENQRFGIKGGWAREALLPTDRAAFSDRIGRGRWDRGTEDMPLPDGWLETQPWTLDVSGQLHGLCGEDGWTYAIDFPPLDAALARGAPRIKTNARAAVRHRRWFRRRAPETRPRIETPVVWHGWLGRRSSGTGRWQSRYFVLTRGLRLHGKVTGIALSYFRAECATHLDVVGTQDLDAWNQLSGKELRTWNLDGAFVVGHGSSSGGGGTGGGTQRRDAAASKGPFQFELRLATETSAVRLSTMSAQQRDIWVAAVDFSVRDQTKRFTLTRSMEAPGGAALAAAVGQPTPLSETPQFSNAILDRLLPLRVDDALHMLFFDADFRDAFFARCGFTIAQEERWSRRKEPGSRRRLEYRTPRRGGVYGGGWQVVQKDKLVRAERGVGYQIDSSAQTPESPYGNIFQDELRCILADWKGKMTRVTVSHRVNLRSEDEAVRLYVESAARGAILTHYTEHWLPFVQKQLKKRRKEERANAGAKLTLHSPSGIQYQVDPNAKDGPGIKPKDPSYNY